MRAVLQRVKHAQVLVGGQVVGAVERGWLILLGVGQEDDQSAASWLVDKVTHLRAFEDDHGKLNLSALDVGAEFLVVSQFTLYGDLARGRRPSFVSAAPPDRAEPLVQTFVDLLRERGFKVATGTFGAMMDVELVNSGPVTFLLSTDAWR